jgi:hypothetical protein
MVRLGWLLLLALSMAAMFAACGNGANDVAVCKQIEDTRCANAPRCPDIDLNVPQHSASLTAVESCQQYYDIECQHGLQTSVKPTSAEVTACIAAINDGVCFTVEHPETEPACAWLLPPTPIVPDASAEAEASTDAALDATADAGAD